MQNQLSPPIVAVVTDRWVCGGIDELVEGIEQALAGGVNMVQIRDNDLSQNDRLELARSLRPLTKGRALLFVNGDLTVSLLSNADGAHLPESQMGEIGRAVRQGKVSCAVHSMESARRAARAGAHLLVAGSVYETKSHPGQRPAGIGLIEQVTATVDLPVIGIGGITAENAGEVIAAGASGVAVIREVLGAPDITVAAMRLRTAVDTAWASRTAPIAKEVKQQ